MFTLAQRRQQVINARLKLAVIKYQQMSQQIAARLFNLDIFKDSQNIACYLSFKNEVDTTAIIDKLFELNKHCYLPTLKPNKEIHYLAYTSDTPLIKNSYGFAQPDVNITYPVSITQLDLVITPLVMFDQDCHRVGWGYGYYDRTFSFLNNCARPTKPFLLGIAYELQKQQNLEPQVWDVPLDAIISETTIYTAKKHY